MSKKEKIIIGLVMGICTAIFLYIEYYIWFGNIVTIG